MLNQVKHYCLVRKDQRTVWFVSKFIPAYSKWQKAKNEQLGQYSDLQFVNKTWKLNLMAQEIDHALVKHCR